MMKYNTPNYLNPSVNRWDTKPLYFAPRNVICKVLKCGEKGHAHLSSFGRNVKRTVVSCGMSMNKTVRSI